MDTVVELFERSLDRDASGPVIKHNEGGSEEILTRAQLFAQARAIAERLAELSEVGERALMVYPSGSDFLIAFCGALYAGVAAVPVYPPDARPGSLERFAALLSDARPSLLLGTQDVLEKLRMATALVPGLGNLRWLATDTISAGDASGRLASRRIVGETTAYIQYTSGSTGTPRGVVHLQRNVAANIAMIRRTFPIGARDSCALWLPLYHDMGLINSLTTISHAGFIALMSPQDFLRNPLRWLHTISREKVPVSGAPNFAYDLCVRKATPRDMAELDLRGWELAYCGAEPVRADTLQRFSETFAPCGFRRQAFAPTYGLAEATLLVSFGPRGAGAHTLALDERAIAEGRVAKPEAGARVRSLVAVGQVHPEAEVAIVDPVTLRRCEPLAIGEIWVRGPGIGQGYWNRPEESESTFRARIVPDGEGPYLRTGDLGFIAEEQLYISGRIKDVIVVRGKNYYPYDLEAAMDQAHPQVRRGSSLATSIQSGDGEGLALFFERGRDAMDVPLSVLIDAVQDRVVAEFGLPPALIAVLEAGGVPKTSSGKLQRNACREAFSNGKLPVLALRDLRTPAAPQPAAAAPDGHAPSEQRAARPGADVVCARIQGEVSKILGQEVGDDAVITRVGITSVEAIEIMFVLEEEFGLAIGPEDLAEPLSIRELSQMLTEREQAVQA